MSKNKEKSLRSLLFVSFALLAIVVVLIVVIVIVSIMNNNRNLAEECLQDEETMSECLADKAFSYSMNDDCTNALKVYDDIPADRFDKYTLSDLYNEAYSISVSCGDESLRDYWSKKFEEISNQIEGMD